MSARRRAAGKSKSVATTKRPASGPWDENDDTGWTVCNVHDYGVQPGATCLKCRLAELG